MLTDYFLWHKTMAQKIQAIKGMNDILPNESERWLYLEEIIRQVMFAYGYAQIRTPIVENTGVFTRSLGEVTDIVEKEMYSFEDRLNGEQLTLRPEGTAGTIRSVVEHSLLYNATQKLWYLGPMFRHEKPQKGRYRQFHQFGVEALGFDGPDIDAEILLMTQDLWQRLGLAEKVTLEINTLGSFEERNQHKKALIAYLETHKSALDEDGLRRLYSNPLRVLDSKNPAMQVIANEAPRLMDYLGADSLQRYAGWKALLDSLGVAYIENHRLVRGMDYYNHSVFEWITHDLGAQGTVCAGGRYDGLTEQLGGKPAAGIGFGLGMERVLLLMAAAEVFPAVKTPEVFIVNQAAESVAYAMTLAKQLRQAGFTVVQHLGAASLKSQMKKADASGANYALIVGETEYTSGQVAFKFLREEREQALISADKVVNFLHTLRV
jgi:histidyl-tRNA synthetase